MPGESVGDHFFVDVAVLDIDFAEDAAKIVFAVAYYAYIFPKAQIGCELFGVFAEGLAFFGGVDVGEAEG